MKKTLTTLVFLLALSVSAMAQFGGGLFQHGAIPEENYYGGFMIDDKNGIGDAFFPTHGQNSNQDAPLGSGIAVLATLGAAYALKKKRK